ncbi:S-adenosyl-L-methionine-dependent tRNA 4-demethylwyosine synthase TYW1-like [Dromiciops gliroides]|uniref:S-adenosyl-L-methionine-dependent tRNA 4-demethylwyosine synthase TYW1-like n=1 Tax=Dromiciops gliroides TaxID=33562 RepID=UPI001CC7F871|nr:S-adenosyl-L-methionine-dependent tRNA 4-demethylwyosine synthase TYW1-like [Dromiciops gliroides]
MTGADPAAPLPAARPPGARSCSACWASAACGAATVLPPPAEDMDAPLDAWDHFYVPLRTLWVNRFYVYLGLAFGISLCLCVQVVIKKLGDRATKKSSVQKAPTARVTPVANGPSSHQKKEVHVSGVKVFYASQTGTAKGFAASLAQAVTALGLPVVVINLKDYDPDDHLGEEVTSKSICVFLVATYTDGRPPDGAEWFCKWLEEASSDFRFGKTYLKGMRYAVFGLGNSAYESNFNKVGRNVDRWLWMLSARRVMTCGEGDSNVVKSRHGNLEADFAAWQAHFLSQLQDLSRGNFGEKKACRKHHEGSCEKGNCKLKKKEGKGEGPRREAPEEEEQFETTSEEESGAEEGRSHSPVVDVEDLGEMMGSMKKAKKEREQQDMELDLSRRMGKNEGSEKREMITPALREALSKQGYQLIGSHSGVKLCRWTKSMLRGRGGCYKHTFYGIESHRCMETTPSLACANKCVFCWRHHTNPVGTEWRWKMDRPDMILQQAIENHQNMIKQFKGVPGVRASRLEEGLQVKHCALSLVGEPIMYPEINCFLKLLHQHRISSFLVTNAQFPTEIRNLEPVTQLYVSVDASTKDSLKKIDRPLFRDFWQRFLDSLRALAAKQQRTVYRLTLVKAWNVEELRAYAELVSLGEPDFIEVKGVTYCGESSASNLTMANVPWHEEVIHFVEELVDLLPNYEIACEHEHSNCLLIAHTKFKIDGEWWTWIDYDRFQELIQEYETSHGSKTFSAKDYMAKTPPWAVFGARERGFDPKDTRFQRKNKSKDISGC